MNVKKIKKTAVVVIPTYNEAENIGPLLEKLFSDVFPSITDWQISVLIVDGNSNDRTVEVIKEKSIKWKDIYLIIENEKSGIGSAYLKGFSQAIDKLLADVVIEFDADFQHPPEIISKLIFKIDEGYDYVLGSRKINGGSEPKGRNVLRRYLTEFGGLLAKLILFFPGKYFHEVTDPTTGLKATRVKDCLDQIDLDPKHLYSNKFGYKVQLLSEILSLGISYVEVPLRFDNRVAGSSKFEPSTIFEIFMACIMVRLHQNSTFRFLRFAVVGFTGYIISSILLVILPNFINSEPLIWAVMTEVAIASNFFLNNIWTFSDKRILGKGKIIEKFFQFNLTSIGVLIIQIVLGTLATSIWGANNRQVILPIIIIFAVVPYNWYVYHRFIWRNRC